MAEIRHVVALGDSVRNRRRELGYTQVEIEELGGPSTSTIRNIEQYKDYQRTARTVRDLELVLKWAPGTVELILKRGF